MKSAGDVVVWCLVLAAGVAGLWLIFATPHRPAAGAALVAAAAVLRTTADARPRRSGKSGRG
jgi:hypothetical protein